MAERITTVSDPKTRRGRPNGLLVVAGMSILVAVFLSVSLAGAQGDTFLDRLLGGLVIRFGHGHRSIVVASPSSGGRRASGY